MTCNSVTITGLANKLCERCNTVHTAVTFIVGSFPVHFELSKRNWIVNYVSSVHSYNLDPERKEMNVYIYCRLRFSDLMKMKEDRRLRSETGLMPSWLLIGQCVMFLSSHWPPVLPPMARVSQLYCRIMSKIDYDKPHLTKTSCLQLDDSEFLLNLTCWDVRKNKITKLFR